MYGYIYCAATFTIFVSPKIRIDRPECRGKLPYPMYIRDKNYPKNACNNKKDNRKTEITQYNKR